MMLPYVSVKVRQTSTPGTTCPTLYEECVGSLTSHRCARACETGPTVCRSYPRRLESLLQMFWMLLFGRGPNRVTATACFDANVQ